jgi:gamma-glutamyl-gamma-aminobutyrate hydrolase PuuD
MFYNYETAKKQKTIEYKRDGFRHSFARSATMQTHPVVRVCFGLFLQTTTSHKATEFVHSLNTKSMKRGSAKVTI